MADANKYTSKLKGSKVLIIGGSSGVGYAVAEALLEQGATIFISSSNPSKIEQATASLRKAYPSVATRVTGQVCDLGDATHAESNIEVLFARTGTVDHVIYTAGDALSMVPISALTMDIMQAAGQVRFFAPLLVAKHAAQHIHAGPRSSITFTGGVVAERPILGWPLVTAFAAGMQGIVKSLAIDLKPVRVNVVQPGMMDTNLYTASGIPEEIKQGIFSSAKEKLPTGFVGAVEDVAEAYVYLLKDTNVTGETINSSGGQLVV